MLQNFVDLELFQKLAIDYDLKDPCAVQSMEKCANEMLIYLIFMLILLLRCVKC